MHHQPCTGSNYKYFKQCTKVSTDKHHSEDRDSTLCFVRTLATRHTLTMDLGCSEDFCQTQRERGAGCARATIARDERDASALRGSAAASSATAMKLDVKKSKLGRACEHRACRVDVDRCAVLGLGWK